MNFAFKTFEHFRSHLSVFLYPTQQQNTNNLSNDYNAEK